MVYLMDLFPGDSGPGAWLFRILLNSLALMAAAYFVKGVHIQDFTRALIVALVLAFLNATIGSVLYVVAMPLRIITLGLFSLVIDAALIMVAGYFLKGFSVDRFGSAFWLAVLLAIFNTVLHWIYL